jgi:hypothetical protein
MEGRNFVFDLTDVAVSEMEEIIESGIRNPLFSLGERVTINYSCNSHVDARSIKSILSRSEFPREALVTVDISTSGVSPEDIFELAEDDRVGRLICSGNNIDTDTSLKLMSRIGRRKPLWIDLEWNCIIPSLFKKGTEIRSDIVVHNTSVKFSSDRKKHTVVIGRQFRNMVNPINFPRPKNAFGLKDDMLVDEFLRHVVGFSWSDLILRPSEIPGTVSAECAIASVPGLILSSALRKCSSDNSERSLPELRLYMFGSCVNGFGSRDSDVDLVVAPANPSDMAWFDKRYSNGDSQRRLSQDYLYYLQRYFVEDAETELVKHARVPVLKVKNYQTSNAKKVDVDITFMNTVCLRNSALLRKYAMCSETCFRLVHLVKQWTKNNELVSSADNGFSLPTSYAWVLICIFFLQERYKAVPPMCKQVGPIKEMWGTKSNSFIDYDPGVLRNSDLSMDTRTLPKSPLTMFVMFLHFLVHEASDLDLDLLGGREDRMRDCSLNVIDPIELDRVVTKNVSSENWELIRTTAELFLDRLVRVLSFGEFLDIIDTQHEPTAEKNVQAPAITDLLDL